jgi:hypothetical protein
MVNVYRICGEEVAKSLLPMTKELITMAKRAKKAKANFDEVPGATANWDGKKAKPGFGGKDTRILKGGKASIYPGKPKGMSIV